MDKTELKNIHHESAKIRKHEKKSNFVLSFFRVFVVILIFLSLKAKIS
jgi:hypothetical protein